jgi:hypothetical protein
MPDLTTLFALPPALFAGLVLLAIIRRRIAQSRQTAAIARRARQERRRYG